jgi:WD40 repeat protein
VTQLAFSPNGQSIALSTEGGFVSLHDGQDPGRLTLLQGHMQGVHALAYSPDGSRLASTSGGAQSVILWDVDTGQELLTLEGTTRFPVLARPLMGRNRRDRE